ncbi:FAD-dependent oxidoreductase [Cereibacter sphaeroides]|nr:FAD-dependent oxidoreductase [Cereibacter sphaeroides]
MLIVGGGASGVLMAVHLLAQSGQAFRVTLVERRRRLGRGIAYSTTAQDHLLNTRVHNMSAFTSDPDHFRDWLARRPAGAGASGDSFVSRSIYGAYLSSLLSSWRRIGFHRRITCVTAECQRLEPISRGIAAHFSDGSVRLADVAILATGHVERDAHPLASPWEPVAVGLDQRVVLVGTGLTMVDQVVSLLRAGHKGEIVALSRRGLLPHGHRPTRPLSLGLQDLPLGAPPSAILRWLRRLAREAEAQGGTWRDAVDGVRPYVRCFWRRMTLGDRSRFLRHGLAWWDIHRHRIPPDSADQLAAALRSGQLRLHRAEFAHAEPGPEGVRLHLRPRGGADGPRTLDCAVAVDCRGIRSDPEAHASPLVADLLRAGVARVDPLRIGLEVTLDCRVVDARGRASDRIFAVGPASRAGFWEITAIPDIREQVARLAALLAGEAADAFDEGRRQTRPVQS